MCRDIVKSHPSLNPEEMVKALMENCLESYEKADAFDGAEETIRELSGKFRMAIASSANRPEIDITLERLKLSQFFSTIVSSDDITRSKPDPEVFLKAAKALGVDPESCVVIEDATTGIKAANSAGMRAIGFVSTGEQDLSEAIAVVNSLREITPSFLSGP
jgi:HAD superfamily hydrolase (TIGR01509 family)